MTRDKEISPGSHVVIIGGGPGGTACALSLHRLASQSGRKLRITIIEGKQFSGDRHYNQCVGVLSPPLPDLLEEDLGIPFPNHLNRRTITRYVLHTDNEHITLDDDHQPSTSLRRIQYDAYMLEAVKERGISVIPARAVDLEFHADAVVIYTESNPLKADVVVGAFGLDEGSAAMFSRHTSYRPPRALSSIVSKVYPRPGHLDDFGPAVHAFLPAHPQIEFGGITPKDDHLTLNIAGREVTTALMREFIHRPEVHQILTGGSSPSTPLLDQLKFFKGRFPCSLAKGYYGNRYVTVGDAAGLVRAFKGKGITSAVQSGIRAAETIHKVGVTEDAFADHYRTANQDIIRDLPYGQSIRLLTILFSQLRLVDPVIRAARTNPELRAALFDAVSAHAPYRQVVRRALRFRALWSILRAW